MTPEALSIRIETPRLILRTVTMADLEAVAAGWDPDGGRLSPEQARERIAWMLDNHRLVMVGTLRHLCLAIVDKESRTVAGWCGLDHRDETRPHPVLFYLLHARHRGKGLATEAAGAVLECAFRHLQLARVDAGATAGNLASKRVLEKIGMRYLGLDGEGGYSFTLGREAFMARKSSELAVERGAWLSTSAPCCIIVRG